MWCLMLFAVLFPRLTLVVVYLFSTFIQRAVPAPELLYAALGFLFAPLSFLWCCAVQNLYGGWGVFQVLVLLICLAIDLGSSGRAERARRSRRRAATG